MAGIPKSYPEYWMREGINPYYMTGRDRILHSNYLSRARQRAISKCSPDNFKFRNVTYTRFMWLREYMLKTWDCTVIERSTYGTTKIPQAEFKLLDAEGNPMMTILAKKRYPKDTWTAGSVTFDAYEFGQKTVRLEAVKNPQSYWRWMYWEELLPFIDDVKSIKARLQGLVKPNTSVLCLADCAKCLGLKATAGPDRLYLLDYNVLMSFGKDGMGITDNPKFPNRYTFGQMCHILNLIAGKPEVELPQ